MSRIEDEKEEVDCSCKVSTASVHVDEPQSRQFLNTEIAPQDNQTPSADHTNHTISKCNSKSTRLPRWVRDLLWLIQDQWFLIVMGILIAIASQVHVPEAHQERKTLIINYLAVSLIFFLNGCAIPTTILIENLLRWRIHLFVQLQCYLVTSATAFAVMSATATNPHFLDEDLLVGVIVTGCLPTAIAFNVVMTRKTEGNSALTLTQSALGNMLGPFLSTALVRLYTSVKTWYTQDLPDNSAGYATLYRQVFMQLGLSVFVPLAVGQIVLNIFPSATRTALFKYKLVKLGSFALLTLIWQTYDEAFATNAFAGISTSNFVFVIFISIGLYFLWLGIALFSSNLWLPIEDMLAVAFTVATKTPAIGLPLTGILFEGLAPANLARIRLEMVFFQALQAACSSLMTIPLRRWKHRRVAKRTNEPAV